MFEEHKSSCVLPNPNITKLNLNWCTLVNIIRLIFDNYLSLSTPKFQISKTQFENIDSLFHYNCFKVCT